MACKKWQYEITIWLIMGRVYNNILIGFGKEVLLLLIHGCL